VRWTLAQLTLLALVTRGTVAPAQFVEFHNLSKAVWTVAVVDNPKDPNPFRFTRHTKDGHSFPTTVAHLQPLSMVVFPLAAFRPHVPQYFNLFDSKGVCLGGVAALRDDKATPPVLTIVKFPNAKPGQVEDTIRLPKPTVLSILAPQWEPGLPWAPRADPPASPVPSSPGAAPASPVSPPAAAAAASPVKPSNPN